MGCHGVSSDGTTLVASIDSQQLPGRRRRDRTASGSRSICNLGAFPPATNKLHSDLVRRQHRRESQRQVHRVRRQREWARPAASTSGLHFGDPKPGTDDRGQRHRVVADVDGVVVVRISRSRIFTGRRQARIGLGRQQLGLVGEERAIRRRLRRIDAEIQRFDEPAPLRRSALHGGAMGDRLSVVHARQRAHRIPRRRSRRGLLQRFARKQLQTRRRRASRRCG